MSDRPIDVRSADEQHVWHPYTQHGVRDELPEITRAFGAHLYDAQGRAIFDAISSWWVTLHGHCQPEVAAAIAAQASTLDHVIFAGFTHEPAALLAAELVARAPAGLERVFYTDNGSTAVEAAVKIALQYWRNRGQTRRLVVALENAYHGDTFGAMSVSARGLFTEPFADHLFEVARLPDPVNGDVVTAFEALIAQRPADIAAIIVEPMLLGAGGMRMWPAASLAALRELAERHGIVFIADEVLTGFGRTGPLFACEHAAIAPDLLCLSKGITGGFMPLAATLATDHLFNSFRSLDRTKTLFHGHSYAANPIACAAARASLALLDDASASRRRLIEYQHRGALSRLGNLPGVTNVRVLGTVLAMELAAPSADRGYLSGVGPALRRFALDRGVLLRPLGNTVYLLPPYCTRPEDLDRAYDVIAEFTEAQ